MSEDNIEAVFRLLGSNLESTDKLIKRHAGKQGPTIGHSQYLPQIRDRLWQIGWACKQIGDMYQHHFNAIMANPIQAFANDNGEWSLSVRFMVEGVYGQAWTVRELAEQLPSLKISPAGLIYVRNHFIAHQHKPQSVLSWSHGAGFDDIGMRLAVARTVGLDDDKRQDPGFWPNIREFLEALQRRFDAIGDGYAFEVTDALPT